MAVSITQTANPAGVAATANVATYTAASIGAAADDRVVVLVVGVEDTSGTINSATIDYGNGAEAMTAGTQGNFGAMYARVFYKAVPTGTTATFAITFGTTPLATENHVSVYRVLDARKVALSTGGDGSTDMDTTDQLTTGAITIPTDGGFIAVAVGATDTVAKTWANATEDLDVDAGLFRFTTATRATALTATAVTCTGTTNAEDGALSYVIFDPLTNYSLTATAIATTAPSVGTPALTQNYALEANGIPSKGIFDTGIFDTGIFDHAVRPGPSVGSPALTEIVNHSLTATGIATGAPSVGAPAITQDHSLTATGITASPIVGSPALTQEHDLTATGIATGAPSVGTPAITQQHELDATGITVSPVVGSPAITQAHVLEATGIATGAPTTGEPAITQAHNLEATGVATGAPTVGTPSLGSSGTDDLTADAIATGAPTVGTPALTQVHVLTAQGIVTGAPVFTLPTLDGEQPPESGAGAGFGWGASSDLQKVGDTRWQSVRQAREAARDAFRAVEKAKPASRPAAAREAAKAVTRVAEAIRQPDPQLPELENGFSDVLADLEQLQAVLADLAAMERIRAAQAREAAAQWARIEAEIRVENAREEELMVVLALAL